MMFEINHTDHLSSDSDSPGERDQRWTGLLL